MIHLDMSNNFFSLPDCYLIKESLFKNKSLFGFHFQGNHGYIDSHGYLIIEEN